MWRRFFIKFLWQHITTAYICSCSGVVVFRIISFVLVLIVANSAKVADWHWNYRPTASFCSHLQPIIPNYSTHTLIICDYHIDPRIHHSNVQDVDRCGILQFRADVLWAPVPFGLAEAHLGSSGPKYLVLSWHWSFKLIVPRPPWWDFAPSDHHGTSWNIMEHHGTSWNPFWLIQTWLRHFSSKHKLWIALGFPSCLGQS